MEHPLFPRKLDPATVRGEFKRAGSSDPDVLAAVRSHLLETSGTAKKGGLFFIILGIVLGLTVVLLPATFIMVPIGLYIRSRANANVGVVDAVFEEWQQKIERERQA